ncbi:phosphomannomutase [Grimontia sp. S25]|uniref:Phosphomannomutase n=1 Tax=Grimontia sedimenti TaxID=2711294 RepID=A0A6M1RII0_9GAMM|nr:phosphomannomutase [Grimontia sedimenti]NGO00131.1 phosphomannomutase [Grimontia sedimenti]
MLITSNVISGSGIQFGTSGARGLVEQFTPEACAAFTHAFISSIRSQFKFDSVAIAIDNRPSSPQMAKAIVSAVKDMGLIPIYYGVVPTPALAYVAMQDGMPSIMVTGSHIPFDRNGLKFYRPDGEITKSDEQAILNVSAEFTLSADEPELAVSSKAAKTYIERNVTLFDGQFLKGRRIGIYEHSSAGRDMYAQMFEHLGAEVVSLERSDQFVPIDTEAVSESDKLKALKWSEEHDLDFIFSTDGDGDRPLVSDEKGNWLRGDVLGLLCAKELGIDALALPVSCNTSVELSGEFPHASRTKIGSPYVIAEFAHLAKKYRNVAGFEANGGFLLGSDVSFNGSVVKALPTRDAVLPALMLLSASRNSLISHLVDQLPKRFTHSDRIQNFATEKSLAILEIAKAQPESFLATLGFDNVQVESIDLTDGLRIALVNGDVIHFRPSGNAPELRCYAESNTEEQAQRFVSQALTNIQTSNFF